LRVLLIGSDLSAFSGIESPTLRRFKDYASRCDKILGLCYSPPGYSMKNIENKVILFPTNSRWKWLFFMDGLRCGLRIIRKWKPELIVAQDTFAFGLLGLILKKITGLPLVIHYHSGFYTNPYWLKERSFNRILARLGTFVTKRADLIRTVSTDIRDDLIKVGLKPHKVFYASPPVAGDRFMGVDHERESQIVEKYNIVPQKTFVFIGRLSKEKNIPMMLKAIERLAKKDSDIKLLMIGDGPEKKRLVGLVHSMGIEKNVIFLGVIPNKELKDYIRSSSALLITSYYEGTAKVIKEAAFAQRITISTCTSGVRDAIREWETGIIIPINDVEALIEAMSFVIENPDQVKTMGQKAREFVMRKFDPEHDVDRIVGLWMYAVAHRNN